MHWQMNGLPDRTVWINALADGRIVRWESVDKCTGRLTDWQMGQNEQNKKMH
jgi:hypothetical protein